MERTRFSGRTITFLTDRDLSCHERVHRTRRNLETRSSNLPETVARLMKAAGLKGVSRRSRPSTTVRRTEARPAPDLVDRDFTASGPDKLWVADITYVPTKAGYLYLAVILDAFG